MYVYCDDCSNGSAGPGDDGSGSSSNSGNGNVVSGGGSTYPDDDDDDTCIGGGPAEPEGAGGDNGGRAFHGSTGKGVLRQMGQTKLSCTSHLSMPFLLHLSLPRQWNTWLQERVRTSSWASRLYWHMAQL